MCRCDDCSVCLEHGELADRLREAGEALAAYASRFAEEFHDGAAGCLRDEVMGYNCPSCDAKAALAKWREVSKD